MGEMEDLANLEKEFADDEVYLAKIKASVHTAVIHVVVYLAKIKASVQLYM